MSSTLSRPPHLESSIHRVAILFAGGPAPAANAVISTAAVSFLRNNIEVYGILHGYSHLVEYGPDHPMAEGRDYIRITHNVLKRTRNSQGILIGTARTNPGKDVSEPAHLKDPQADRPVEDGLRGAGVAGRRRPDLHRRRRHAQDGQQVQALPGAAAAGTQAHPGRPSAEDDRQRLLGHRLHLRLLHGRRGSGRRDPQPAGRRRVDPQLLHRRDDGPQRRLAGLRRGHRRRGQPGDQRRGHHRQVRGQRGDRRSHRPARPRSAA